MYRGYEADWTTPRRPGVPVTPRVPIMPPIPSPPDWGQDPGAEPDYKRRFPMRPAGPPPAPPIPLPPNRPSPGWMPPLRRFPARVPVLQMLEWGKYAFDRFGNFSQPIGGRYPGFGYTFPPGSWHIVCGPVGTPDHWYWGNLGHNNLCGLTGQAIAPFLIDQGPFPYSEGYNELKAEPTPDRYTIITQWHKHDPAEDASAAMPGVPRAQPYWQTLGAYPWTPTLPLVHGIVPLHVPWAVIPYVANSQAAEASVRGPGVGPRVMTIINTRRSVQTTISISPGSKPHMKTTLVPYIPNPQKAGIGVRVRERKGRLGAVGSAVAAAAGGFVNVTTEANDFVEALFKALPSRLQRDFRRTTSFVSPADYIYRRTAFVIANAGQLELDQAIANVLANQIEDRAYGAYFGARRRVWNRHRYWEHDIPGSPPRPSLEAPDI